MERCRGMLLAVFMLLTAGLAMAGAPTATASGAAKDTKGKVPVTTSSKEALSSFLEGRTLFENLRLTDAFDRFQKAVDKDPNFAMGFMFLAQTAPTAKGFFDNMEKAVSMSKNASQGEQLWIKGFRAGAYGDPAGQKEAYEKLADMFPRDERAQALLGIYHVGQQEFEQGARYLQKAIDISPTYAPAYNQLGYAYRFLEKFKESEQTFKKYTELIPQDPNPYDSYAELLLKMGMFDEAITQYRKALAIDQHFANSHYGIAAALMYQGKHDDARAELKTALEEARTDAEKRAALFNTALTYNDEGTPELALQELDKQFAIAENGNDPANMAGDMTAKGNILLDMGKAADAREDFEKALGLINGSALAPTVKDNASLIHHYNMCRVLLHEGKLPQAKAEAEQFRKGAEAKKNENQIRLAHELAGMIAMDEKQFATAVRELNQASLQDPYNLYRLALSYQGNGQKEEAKKFCTAAAHFNALPFMNYSLVRRKAESMLAAI